MHVDPGGIDPEEGDCIVRRILLVSVVGAIVGRMARGTSWSCAAWEIKAYESWQWVPVDE